MVLWSSFWKLGFSQDGMLYSTKVLVNSHHNCWPILHRLTSHPSTIRTFRVFLQFMKPSCHNRTVMNSDDGTMQEPRWRTGRSSLAISHRSSLWGSMHGSWQARNWSAENPSLLEPMEPKEPQGTQQNDHWSWDIMSHEWSLMIIAISIHFPSVIMLHAVSWSLGTNGNQWEAMLKKRLNSQSWTSREKAP